MKLSLVQIGNSWGIRIPKVLLEQCKFKKGVNVTVVDGNLLLSPITAPRDGWADAFKKMAKTGDDQLLNPELIESDFDKGEWEW